MEINNEIKNLYKNECKKQMKMNNVNKQCKNLM